VLEREVNVAIEQGELVASHPPGDIAFALNAFASAASWGYQLTGDPTALSRARRLMLGLLGGSPAGHRPPGGPP
jgi:hypothetical protein